MVAAPAKRTPGTYIVLGRDGAELIRLPVALRTRAASVRRKLKSNMSVARLLGTAVAVGLEIETGKTGKGEPLERLLKREAKAAYKKAYGDKPGPGFGQWAAYLIETGLNKMKAG